MELDGKGKKSFPVGYLTAKSLKIVLGTIAFHGSVAQYTANRHYPAKESYICIS